MKKLVVLLIVFLSTKCVHGEVSPMQSALQGIPSYTEHIVVMVPGVPGNPNGFKNEDDELRKMINPYPPVGSASYVDYLLNGFNPKKILEDELGLKGHVYLYDYVDKTTWDSQTIGLKDFINTVSEKHPGRKVILIAHSLGGMLTLDYLVRYCEGKPHNIAGCIFLDGALGGVDMVSAVIASRVLKITAPIILGVNIATHIWNIFHPPTEWNFQMWLMGFFSDGNLSISSMWAAGLQTYIQWQFDKFDKRGVIEHLAPGDEKVTNIVNSVFTDNSVYFHKIYHNNVPTPNFRSIIHSASLQSLAGLSNEFLLKNVDFANAVFNLSRVFSFAQDIFTVTNPKWWNLPYEQKMFSLWFNQYGLSLEEDGDFVLPTSVMNGEQISWLKNAPETVIPAKFPIGCEIVF